MTERDLSFVKLTELGREYGLGAAKVGMRLETLGFRRDGRPTSRAVSRGFVLPLRLKNGRPYWLWHRQKTMQVLDDAGQPRATQADRDLRVMKKMLRDLASMKDGNAQKDYRKTLDPRERAMLDAALKEKERRENTQQAKSRTLSRQRKYVGRLPRRVIERIDELVGAEETTYNVRYIIFKEFGIRITGNPIRKRKQRAVRTTR